MAKGGVDFSVEVDNRAAIKRQLAENIPLALNAMGLKGVGLITDTMEHGYAKRIWLTGNLQRDVKYLVDGNELVLGNTLDYSLYVHEGTRKMAARHYIRDTLYAQVNLDQLITVGRAYLTRGLA